MSLFSFIILHFCITLLCFEGNIFSYNAKKAMVKTLCLSGQGVSRH